MNRYSALSWRYLKQQRRRSLLTVFGIVLSVALISGLGTMGQSIKDNMLRQAIRENGAFHVAYPNGSPDLYDRLKHHALVDKLGAMHKGTESPLDGRYRIRVNAASETMFDLAPIHLTEGRIPASPDEVVVEEWALRRLPGKPGLGGQTRLAGPDGNERTYTIVGVLQNRRYTQFEGVAEAYTLWTEPGTLPQQDIYLSFKSGVDISAHLKEFLGFANVVSVNNEVLRLMGESPDERLNQTLNTIFGILIGLVVLSTVAVIYNTFHIAVLERIRQFGLLRTIGATPRQIRHLVFREGTILALAGIPLGLAAGWGALALVLWLMTSAGFTILQMEDFRLTFHWRIMGGSALIGLVSIYAAAWLPARRASRVSPVEAAKGAVGLMRETYRRGRLPSPLQAAGIAGKMAAKNIRRNRVKFRITTFSIAVSILLFVVFHYFAREAFDLTVATNEEGRIAFSIHQIAETTETNGRSVPPEDIVSADTLRRIAEIPGIAGVYGDYGFVNAQVLVPEAKLNRKFLDKTGITYPTRDRDGANYYVVNAPIRIYDEARLQAAAKYLKSGTADPAELLADDGVLIVQTAKPYLHREKKWTVLELASYRPGDTIAIVFNHEGPETRPPNAVPPTEDREAPAQGRAGESGTVRELKVTGVLSESPFGASYNQDGLIVILSTETYAKLYGSLPERDRPASANVLSGVDIALADGADVRAVREALEEIVADIPGGQLIDVAAEQQQSRQFNIQMKIFVYGFLTIIGLIGSLNIINTVQTNLLLRRREFALLQAVGMTPGQLRWMATAEGLWFGVIGGCFGLALSIPVTYLLFWKLSGIQGMLFNFPWTSAAAATGIAMAVGVLSVQGPMRRLARVNLTAELREDG
jgi:putative ABC transport system permease protein